MGGQEGGVSVCDTTCPPSTEMYVQKVTVRKWHLCTIHFPELWLQSRGCWYNRRLNLHIPTMGKLIVPCLSKQQHWQPPSHSLFPNRNDLTRGADPGKDVKGVLTGRLSVLYGGIPCGKIHVTCPWALFLLAFWTVTTSQRMKCFRDSFKCIFWLL